MKLKIFYLLIAVLGLSTTMACSDDDDDTLKAPAAIETAFNAKYPNAKNVKWERNGVYYVADFKTTSQNHDAEAWYNVDAIWCMTKKDYGKDLFMIPAVINQAFNDTEFALWTIDDIHAYEYPNESKNMYEIEVEKAGNPDTALYFNAEGGLLKATTNTDMEITPETII